MQTPMHCACVTCRSMHGTTASSCSTCSPLCPPRLQPRGYSTQAPVALATPIVSAPAMSTHGPATSTPGPLPATRTPGYRPPCSRLLSPFCPHSTSPRAAAWRPRPCCRTRTRSGAPALWSPASPATSWKPSRGWCPLVRVSRDGCVLAAAALGRLHVHDDHKSRCHADIAFVERKVHAGGVCSHKCAKSSNMSAGMHTLIPSMQAELGQAS